jgi:hypothetical protein
MDAPDEENQARSALGPANSTSLSPEDAAAIHALLIQDEQCIPSYDRLGRAQLESQHHAVTQLQGTSNNPGHQDDASVTSLDALAANVVALISAQYSGFSEETIHQKAFEMTDGIRTKRQQERVMLLDTLVALNIAQGARIEVGAPKTRPWAMMPGWAGDDDEDVLMEVAAAGSRQGLVVKGGDLGEELESDHETPRRLPEGAGADVEMDGTDVVGGATNHVMFEDSSEAADALQTIWPLL